MINPKRILVAEDDLATREALCKVVSASGATVEVTADGQQALDLIYSFDPQIVLLDLKLPNKDGIQVLAEIRSKGLQIPTIVISGEGGFSDTVQSIKLGA